MSSKLPIIPVIGRIAVLGLALTAVGCASSSATNGPGASAVGRPVPLRIDGLYRTQQPRLLLAPVEESTTDTHDRCFARYRFTASVHGGTIRIEQTRAASLAPSSGPACASAARPALQKVRLPAAWQGRHLVDAADGKPIKVLATLPASYASVTPIG